VGLIHIVVFLFHLHLLNESGSTQNLDEVVEIEVLDIRFLSAATLDIQSQLNPESLMDEAQGHALLV
jgi:hypothetical protein